MIFKCGNNELRVFTTTIPTEYRLPTLMHDPVYRLGIAWQNVAYNQPPHSGYFLGAGMAAAPHPNITTVPADLRIVPGRAPRYQRASPLWIADGSGSRPQFPAPGRNVLTLRDVAGKWRMEAGRGGVGQAPSMPAGVYLLSYRKGGR